MATFSDFLFGVIGGGILLGVTALKGREVENKQNRSSGEEDERSNIVKAASWTMSGLKSFANQAQETNDKLARKSNRQLMSTLENGTSLQRETAAKILEQRMNENE